MSKPSLIYYEIQDFQKKTLDYIHQHFNVTTLQDPDQDTDEILKSAQVVFAPMGYIFDQNKIERCANLQVIATPTTGTVHIDAEYAKAKNIAICSLKDQKTLLNNITPTAELAWGLVLAATRKIPWAFESLLEGQWIGREFGGKTPKMLSNMTLGVVGLGRLGSWVARYGQAFKMEVFYFDPYVSDNLYARCSSILELAEASDVLSVHVHLTAETEDLIDEIVIAAMSRGSYIINTSRGGVVNEAALLDALKSGHLAGAGLDLLEGEHLPDFKGGLKAHPLINYAKTHDNLVITPKIGGCTVDAWVTTERRVLEMTIDEINKRNAK